MESLSLYEDDANSLSNTDHRFPIDSKRPLRPPRRPQHRRESSVTPTKKFTPMRKAFLIIRSKGGNNRFGTKGREKCSDCRRLKRAVLSLSIPKRLPIVRIRRPEGAMRALSQSGPTLRREDLEVSGTRHTCNAGCPSEGRADGP